ncbi:asparaginase-domain-containing protein [Gloeopeniophorella convolvens]|nr:asparaginase-domain-containing protein [Gloeopeniophorella convolvens]
MELALVSDESKVLIIYTGGTIGMLVGEHGYVPEPYFLTETLRSQTRFHDPLQDSLFSHASTVEGFRQWSSSGRSSPVTAEFTATASASQKHSTLLVRSSRPMGAHAALGPTAAQHPMGAQPHSIKVAEDVYEARMPALVTPRSAVAGGIGKRIRYAVLEWQPLLDSSNIEIEDWIRIATEIELNYSLFDAFVILHGTDTMAYTSSALSFLLEDLGKTVIVTGAQIPLSQLRNDAVDNLLGALSVAGHYIIPECCLFFNHTLFRGNRVSKASSHDFDAFMSPNFPPLVNVGIDIVVNWNDVIRQTSMRRFRAHKATLRLFPGITAATVRAFLTPPIKGVVLETFGAGNAPQRNDLMSALREACDRGVVVVAITQCARGAVSDAYETGRTLLQAGVVPGGDMTPESALTKLSYLLAKPELSAAQVRSLIVVSDAAAGDEPADADAGAPWAWTAGEAAATQGALSSWLIHLAAAADDAEGLAYCLSADAARGEEGHAVAGGIVNWINPASGRSPLHVAALGGSARSVRALLKAGALVHLRDTLGHTALYYAARQGHEEIVSTLVSAGANLGGADVEGFASLAMKTALGRGDHAALDIWQKAGFRVPDRQGERSKDEGDQ